MRQTIEAPGEHRITANILKAKCSSHCSLGRSENTGHLEERDHSQNSKETKCYKMWQMVGYQPVVGIMTDLFAFLQWIKNNANKEPRKEKTGLEDHTQTVYSL